MGSACEWQKNQNLRFVPEKKNALKIIKGKGARAVEWDGLENR